LAKREGNNTKNKMAGLRYPYDLQLRRHNTYPRAQSEICQYIQRRKKKEKATYEQLYQFDSNQRAY